MWLFDPPGVSAACWFHSRLSAPPLWPAGGSDGAVGFIHTKPHVGADGRSLLVQWRFSCSAHERNQNKRFLFQLLKNCHWISHNNSGCRRQEKKVIHLCHDTPSWSWKWCSLKTEEAADTHRHTLTLAHFACFTLNYDSNTVVWKELLSFLYKLKWYKKWKKKLNRA